MGVGIIKAKGELMSVWKIYHNPKCSKSRQTLELLKQNGIEPQVIEYLKNSLDESTLLEIIDALDVPVSQLVRTKEAQYKETPFDINSVESVVSNLTINPILMERPVVLKESQAVLGRPPENIKKLLD